MLELFINHPNEMELRTVDSLPAPKSNEIKIKLIYGGICGSDLRVYKGIINYASYPVRFGHELVGSIIEKGDSVDYKIGTRVVINPNTFCGQCDMCAVGKTNICRHKKSLGINQDGGFAEEFIISSQFALPIPEGIADEKAVLIEPLSVVIHAFNKVNITKNTLVAIVGCGSEGMLAASLADYLGANITAIDINPIKLDLARSLGENINAVHPDELNHKGFDVVIEAAGTKQSIEHAIQLVKPGGSMIMIGIAQEAILPVPYVVRNEISLYGTIIYNFPADYLEAMKYLQDDKFNAERIVSEILPYSEYKKAFDHALSGNYGKIILSFKEV